MQLVVDGIIDSAFEGFERRSTQSFTCLFAAAESRLEVEIGKVKKAKPRHTDEDTNLGGFGCLFRTGECFLDLSLEAKTGERELFVSA